MRNSFCLFIFTSTLILLSLTSCTRGKKGTETVESAAIILPEGASLAERLAAKEIRRYFYLRTGKLLSIITNIETSSGEGLIVVGNKDRELVKSFLFSPELRSSVGNLAPEEYRLKTVSHGNQAILLVAGGDDSGTLYGAYRMAEIIGVRFYLHGDVVPDLRIEAKLPQVDETGKPLFLHRGIQPFHDFPEGPDWWDDDLYKVVLAQLPKLRMNFFGLHTYPEGDVGPEPTVWIGLPEDIDQDGKVKSSYPARHFTTLSGTWGYRPTQTGKYAFSAGELYDRDDYGAAYMQGMTPWPRRAEDCNEMFYRMGRVLREAFTFAHKLGIRTCVGTETPLAIPAKVKEHLKTMGKNPADSSVVEALYQGIFQRIMKTYPLDYYWFWTPEGWTWRGADEKQVAATLADFRAAIAAAKKINAPFTLATCGWVLGPQNDRALFDNVLPREMPMSCINREVGKDPVEPGFAMITGRPKWAIPWLEDDPALIVPQLWAGRMRRDAADALAYGCTGLMGIHWRTRILGPNISSLAHAAWDQRGWNPEFEKKAAPAENQPAAGKKEKRPRDLPAEDFYTDWALYEFGPEAAESVAKIFTSLDGRLPCPSTWVNGPGGIKPDSLPWEETAKKYAFVGEMEKLRQEVKGPGNLERFDYWFNSFRYLRAVAKVSSTWTQFNMAMDKVKAGKGTAARKNLAREIALPLRKELVGCITEAQKYLFATISTTGEIGTVTNWQQHLLPALLDNPGKELVKILGENLPPEAMVKANYDGPVRLIVPKVRTSLDSGEPLNLEMILLGAKPKSAAVYWRQLGQGQFAAVPFEPVNRGVYKLSLPAEATGADFEYYLEAVTDDSRVLRFPATTPEINQTVVVLPAESGR